MSSTKQRSTHRSTRRVGTLVVLAAVASAGHAATAGAASTRAAAAPTTVEQGAGALTPSVAQRPTFRRTDGKPQRRTGSARRPKRPVRR